VSATLTTTPAAGWSHDPSDSAAWRWWDGGTWTAHVRPKEETAPVAVSAPAQPAAPVQPTTLTPEIPASEQSYWHSAEAEVIKIPGRKGTTADAVYRRGGDGHVSGHYARRWGEVGSPQTAGIWLLALLPTISGVLLPVVGYLFSAIVGPTGAIDNPMVTTQTALAVITGYAVTLTIVAWIFAGRDIAMLRARGYDPPAIWWMLVPLSPLAYFIARGRVVRAEGKRAWPPELLFFLSIILPIVLVALTTIFAMSILASVVGTVGIPL
jgi:hypothetical protein